MCCCSLLFGQVNDPIRSYWHTDIVWHYLKKPNNQDYKQQICNFYLFRMAGTNKMKKM